MKPVLKASTLFWSFLVVYAFLWVLIPSLMRHVTPMDSTEGAMWARVLQWGYPRDPWLNAVLTKLALFISFGRDWGIYLMSAVMVLIAIWSVWRLAKIILKNDSLALLSVIILVGIQYYNLGVIDFNDNACELGLWPLMALYFYRSLTTNRLKHWVLLGLFSGLGMMAKYYTAVPLVCMLLFMLFQKANHRFFKQYRLYLALFILFVIVTPHIVWLFEHQLMTIRYSMVKLDQTDIPRGFYDQYFASAIHFFFAQIGTFMGAVAIFLFACFGKAKRCKRLNDKLRLSDFNRAFLFYVGLGPFLLTLMLSVIFRWKINTMWGIPLLSLWGIILVSLCRPVLTKAKLYRAMFVASLVTVMLLVGYSISLSKSTTSSANYPARKIADIVTDAWHQRYQTPLYYVAGYNKPVSYMVRYSEDYPQGLIDFNPQLNPKLNMNDLRKKGAVFILIPQMGGPSVFSKAILEQNPNLMITPYQQVAWENAKPGQKPMRFQIAYLPPQHFS